MKVAIDYWTKAGNITEGYVFRPVLRGDQVSGDRLGEKVVWQMLRQYAAEIGIPGALRFADYTDCRRTEAFWANFRGSPRSIQIEPTSASLVRRTAPF